MAYIKIKWRKDVSKKKEMSASDYEQYLLKERGSEKVVNTYNCTEGQVISDFRDTQAYFGKEVTRGSKSNNLAFEVIHSFSPQESQSLSGEKINLMGTELAKRYFPNHEFLVVTHTDTSKHHNHILVNPVNERTGKREITDKKAHLYNLRTVANEISKENGLSIIKETEKEKSKKVPQKVKEIQRRGGKSYRLDLFQKADFARNFATSFDEYVGVLNEFSISVAITDKKITYFYEGHEKGIRGDKLGNLYDKKGLIQKFKSNDELFLKNPQLRRKIRDGITHQQTSKGDALGVPGPLFRDGGTSQEPKGKNYEAFTKSHRRWGRTPIPSDHALRHSLIPISELRKASNSDILEYCQKNKIKTKTNSNGQTVLSKREHITIEGSRWKNTQNKTTGSLIDIVAVHEQTNFLNAISKITGNKNLLLLEQYMGEVKKPYSSFYIPKEKKANFKTAKYKLDKFLKHKGINSSLSDDLFKHKKVQVTKEGKLFFFSKNNQKEALEFSFEKEGYKSKRYGDKTSPFLSSYKNEQNITVFPNFLDFLKSKGTKSFESKSSKPYLVLMGLDEKAMHIFLAHHPNIKSIDIAESKDKSAHRDQWNFINRLKKDLSPYGIQVNQVSFDRALSKSKGIELNL